MLIIPPMGSNFDSLATQLFMPLFHSRRDTTFNVQVVFFWRVTESVEHSSEDPRESCLLYCKRYHVYRTAAMHAGR